MILPPKSRQSGDASEDNMLPMINVVFLLLIFFMLAGQASSDADIHPPSSVSNLEHSTELVLGMDRQGQLKLNHQSGAVTLEQLPDWLADFPNAHIELRADAEADSNQVIAVIDQLQQAGVEKVLLRTTYQ